MPDSLLTDTRFEVDDVRAAAIDTGIAARRDGISADGAQAFFDTIATGFKPPVGETFESDAAMSELRAALGPKMEETVDSIQKWVKARPAVAALLDEGVMLGNHTPTLLTLGGIAHAEKQGLKITEPRDAKVFVERVMNDQTSPYWNGSDPLHKLFVASMQFALAVANGRK